MGAKFCKDCRHYVIGGLVTPPFCDKSLRESADIVSGKLHRWHQYYCYEMRAHGECGPDAKLFEQKPTLVGRLRELFNKETK